MEQDGYIALGTVVVLLKSEKKQMVFYSLLDNGSPKTNVSVDVVADLNTEGKTKIATINAPNNHFDAFEMISVEFGLQNVDG